jgi:hypothetical protein
MFHRRSIAVVTLMAALTTETCGTWAFDDQQYPDWKGQWRRSAAAQWDPNKPAGLGQQVPLTSEYREIWVSNMKTQLSGGEDYNAQAFCIPSGMPRMMIAYEPMEFVITPETTYVLMEHMSEHRRIYTDGRIWPEVIEPSFSGYSIGRWVDDDGDGRFDALEVETRGFKGPRTYDASGIPLHRDNQTIVHERFHRDKSDANLLLNDVTTVDHALTRPWTVTRSYRRASTPIWTEMICGEENHHVLIGKESYFLSVDGLLMPTRKGQPPPDLKFFDQSPN